MIIFGFFFQNPNVLTESDDEFLRRESRHLDLPASDDSNSLVLEPWLRYARQERQFLEAKSTYYEKRLDSSEKVSLDLIWDGRGKNQNAGLTIYRHFDSAAVLKGLVGDTPKTAWVLNYSLLERIHYLLVAGYDVYGNVGHQLNTRLYMDFLRMEGEFNFLSMLPLVQRVSVRDAWYQGASQDVRDYVYGKYAHFNRETGIAFPAGEPADQALMGMLKSRLSTVASTVHDLRQINDLALERELRALASVRGTALSWLPEAAMMRVVDGAHSPSDFTLVRNTGHRNITYLLNEKKEIAPEKNTLDVLRGVGTAYPNAFYRITRADLPVFTQQVRQLKSQKDYNALVRRFGVDRMSPDFWTLSDSIYKQYLQAEPIDGGVLDLSRLEGRH